MSVKTIRRSIGLVCIVLLFGPAVPNTVVGMSNGNPGSDRSKEINGVRFSDVELIEIFPTRRRACVLKVVFTNTNARPAAVFPVYGAFDARGKKIASAKFNKEMSLGPSGSPRSRETPFEPYVSCNEIKQFELNVSESIVRIK